jgi:hypothetical protein
MHLINFELSRIPRAQWKFAHCETSRKCAANKTVVFQGFTTIAWKKMRRKKAQNSGLNHGVQFISKITQKALVPNSN